MSHMIPDRPGELVLTESRTMRAQTAGRVEVLDKVKALALLPDGVHATTEIVASFYEVDAEAVRSLVKDHRAELAENGHRVLQGEELRSFKDLCGIDSRARSLAVFDRRAVLNVGQLLRDSEVARRVRTYLLEVEEAAAPEARIEAAEGVVLAEARMRVLKAAEGIVDAAWLETKARLVAAKALGEEPDTDPLDAPLYIPDFLKTKGLRRKEVESVQSWFGRRAAALFEEEHGAKPGKRQTDLPNGSVRETYAWTRRHLPVFEKTWARFYADRYPAQGQLGGAA